MKPWIGLVRGINVGGRNQLPMAGLIAAFEAAGCTDVRTYIQSGNVVFECDADMAANVAHEVAELIEHRFGLTVPVVIRSADAFRDAVAANPFLGKEADPAHLAVGFLATSPSSSDIASLDAQRSDVDSFEVLGSEVYLHMPGGAARSKLTTAYFDRALDTTMTVRNWRTVNKLVEMLAQD